MKVDLQKVHKLANERLYKEFPFETIDYGLADGIIDNKKWLEFIGEDNAN